MASKLGKCINVPAQNGSSELAASKTSMLDDLSKAIEKEKISGIDSGIVKGLTVARVFGNPEAQIVTAGHRFAPKESVAIEHAVLAIDRVGFDETLDVSIGFRQGTRSAFQSSRA